LQQPEQKAMIAATCDGVALTWNLTHVSAGIKLVDPCTVDLRTGQLIFGVTRYNKLQSHAA
jgi:hypothetical protein